MRFSSCSCARALSVLFVAVVLGTSRRLPALSAEPMFTRQQRLASPL